MRTHAPRAHTLVGYRSHLRDQMEQKHPELATGSVGKWTPGLTLGCGQWGRDFLSYRQMLQEVCIFMGGAYFLCHEVRIKLYSPLDMELL